MNSVKLADIVILQKGKKPKNMTNIPTEGYLPYIDIKAFEKGIIDNYADGEKCLPCEDGELLIVCDGSRSGLIGIAKKGYVGSTLAKISADGINISFLAYFLKGKYRQLNTSVKGTGTPHVNQEILKSFELVVPSTLEQNRIVEKLDELFSELDNGIETLQKTKAQLKVYRQAVLEQAFDGDYPLVKLNELSVTVSGYAFKSKLYDEKGEYTIVKIGNVKNRFLDFSRDHTLTNEISEQIKAKYLLKYGDCLITMTGSRNKRDYGYVKLIKGEKNLLLNQRVCAIRFNIEKVIPEFYEYYLCSSNFRNQFFKYETGNVGQGNVGIKGITDTTVICPTKNNQAEIIKEIESRLSICDQIEKTVDESLRQAESLRQSILKQAFEGRLV